MPEACGKTVTRRFGLSAPGEMPRMHVRSQRKFLRFRVLLKAKRETGMENCWIFVFVSRRLSRSATRASTGSVGSQKGSA